MPASSEGKEVNMGNVEMKEVHPGRFAIMQDGKVVRMATDGETRFQLLKDRLPVVDAGTMEISLALAAVSAIMATSASTFGIKVLGTLAFSFSLLAAYFIYGAYLMVRIPKTIIEFYNTSLPKKDVALFFWVLIYWPFQLLKVLNPFTPDFWNEQGFADILESGYVMLFWGLLFAGAGGMHYVIFSFR